MDGLAPVLDVYGDEAPFPDDDPAVYVAGDPPQEESYPWPDHVGFLEVDDEEEPEWAVPNMLAAGERLIVTGDEGGGKSTLLRQWAVQIAAGIHPFTLEPFEADSVVLVDLENSEDHVRRKLRPLVDAVVRIERNALFPIVRPEGLNLLDTDDEAWLTKIVDTLEPAVVILGPLYKLSDEYEGKHARKVTAALDRIRAKPLRKPALILEAHRGHAINGATKRPDRPIDSSVWLRWPEFGFFLGPEGEWRAWRGPREERPWPSRFSRGADPWPWTASTTEENHAPSGGEWMPTELMVRVSDYLEYSGEASKSEICTAVGGRRQYVLQAIDHLVRLGHVARERRGKQALVHRFISAYSTTAEAQPEPAQ